MRCLLDTHALIWWWADSPQLSPKARDLIVDPSVQIAVSTITGLEMGIKVRIGKLEEMRWAVVNYAAWLADEGMESIDITAEHAVSAGLLPGDHRDPFDRLIAAQAIAEDIPVLTRDPALASLGCAVIW